MNVNQISKYCPVPHRSRPLLAGLAAEMITQAIHVASRGDVSLQNFDRLSPAARRNSRTASAHALRWLRARSNWTLIPLERRMKAWGAPAPPADVRAEYALTFSWCCEILGIDEEQTRRQGAPFRADHHSAWFSRGGLDQWREWRATRGKLHKVYAKKAKARKSAGVLPADANPSAGLVPDTIGTCNSNAHEYATAMPEHHHRSTRTTAAINFTWQFSNQMPASYRVVPVVSAARPSPFLSY